MTVEIILIAVAVAIAAVDSVVAQAVSAVAASVVVRVAVAEPREVGNTKRKRDSIVNATKTLNTQQIESVEECIREAEKATAAEIVCAVATESGRYDRAESIFGILGAVVGLGGGHFIARSLDNDGMWSAEPEFSLLVQMSLVIFGFLAGVILTSIFKSLRACVISTSETNEEIQRSAQIVLADAVLASPRSAGAVLLYISLAERRASVLCDRLANVALEQEILETVCNAVLKEIKENDIAQALTVGVTLLAEHLAEKIPPGDSNENELENHVLLIHPRP